VKGATPAHFLRLYRRGARLKAVMQLAGRISDENWKILIKALAKEIDSRPLSRLPDVEIVICLLDEDGALAGRTMKEQAKLVSDWLHYTIELDAYRKRVERLRRISGTNFRSI
jgi:hypothetical protein